MKVADDLKKAVNDYGDFHDCEISSIEITNNFETLRIFISDLHANFLGLPEYGGPKPAFILCQCMSFLKIDLAKLSDSVRIYETTVDYCNDEKSIEVKLYPEGCIKLSCKSVEIIL